MAKALTALSVDKQRPDPSRRLEIPDGLIVGLYLVVQTSGRKSWAVRYRHGGKPRKLALGAYPALGLAEAREAAKTALLAVQRGEDPAREKQERRRAATDHDAIERDLFPTVARQFIEKDAKPRNRGWRDQARILGLRPEPEAPEKRDDPTSFIVIPGSMAAKWEKRRIQEITRRDVLDVLDAYANEGRPVAANRALATVRKMFNWAVGRDILAASPATGIKAPARETSRDRVLTDVELRAAWKAAGALGWPWGPFVQMLILSGQRRDEVAGMAWGEVDIDARLWTIPRQRAKNDVAHDVPLSAQALAVLEKLPTIAGKRGFVFTTTGETHISGFSRAKLSLDEKMLKILRKEAAECGEDADRVEIPPWRLHDIRRTVATGMARIGINLPTIEKVLNHVSGSFHGIVGVYQRHSFADEKRTALEAWGEFVVQLDNRATARKETETPTAA